VRTPFGHVVETFFHADESVHKTITAREGSFAQNYASVNDLIKDITDFHKIHKSNMVKGI